MVAGASDYWSISFDEKRANETRFALYETVRRYQSDDEVLEHLQATLLGNQVRAADNDESWLLASLTEMLLSDQAGTSAVSLGPL